MHLDVAHHELTMWAHLVRKTKYLGMALLAPEVVACLAWYEFELAKWHTVSMRKEVILEYSQQKCTNEYREPKDGPTPLASR